MPLAVTGSHSPVLTEGQPILSTLRKQSWDYTQVEGLEGQEWLREDQFRN